MRYVSNTAFNIYINLIVNNGDINILLVAICYNLAYIIYMVFQCVILNTLFGLDIYKTYK